MTIPANETRVKELDKTVADIQENIQKTGNKITGKSKYLTDIKGVGGDGNYLVLEFPQAKDAGNTVVCSFEGGEETTLSADDYQYLIKLNEKKPITVKVTGKVEANVTLDISGIELEQKMG